MWCYWLEIWNYQYKNKFDQLAALFLVFFLSLFASSVRLLVVVVVVRLPASQVLFCIFSLRGSRWTPGAGCFTVHRTTNLDEFASLRDLAVFFLGKIFEFPTFFGTKRELTVSSPESMPFFWVWSRPSACASSCWEMSMRRGFWRLKASLEILFRPFLGRNNPPQRNRMKKTVRNKRPNKNDQELTVLSACQEFLRSIESYVGGAQRLENPADENGRSSKVPKAVDLSIWWLLMILLPTSKIKSRRKSLGKLIEHDHGEDRW